MNNKIWALMLLGVMATHVNATENGLDTFGLGAEGIAAGALPPAGVYLLNYYQNYHASEFKDGPDNFHADVNVYIPRLVWMTPQHIAGGQLGLYAAQPLVDLRLNVMGMSDSNSGLGDLIIGSMLGWHKGNHHSVAALEGVLATGDYEDANPHEHVVANLGKNYNTIRPIFAYSYLQPQGWEFSTKMSYSFNSENDDTNYQSGDYFAGDYAIGYQLNDQVKLALEGYVFKQTTDDEVNGVSIGNKGQALSFGPAIQYKRDNWSLEAKFLKETEVEHRPEGHSSTLKLVWAF
ncbi:SphA family protein [Acinetobacter towneri]|uniref:Transporter n=1 Tax=Acinetobacter towneri TaxID=202956 RepID=A0AB35LZ05_9GAMM|nr:transporter [Acinetobacter towneri]MDM1718481.1 transporter [Acinetobacter towneri]MDM1730435.1 transporter [Acinetobacter towneri]MDM1732995.1 transporter [Acinetobacter towneri]MDM1735394.1 transporter [Acinetobacter towneri]MDM1738566.1 transporter [Acinetobacter towneri]